MVEIQPANCRLIFSDYLLPIEYLLSFSYTNYIIYVQYKYIHIYILASCAFFNLFYPIN